MRFLLHFVVGKQGVVLPRHNVSGGAGGVHINDALVAAAAEPQADVVLILHKIAVHQHVNILQKLVGHLTPPWTGLQNVALIGVAGVAPDSLVGVQCLYAFYKGQQGALVFRLQRLAPQQGQTVDVIRLQTLQNFVALKQLGQWRRQPETNRLVRTPSPLAISQYLMVA